MVRTGALLLGLCAAALALIAPIALAIDLPATFLAGHPVEQQTIWLFAWYAPALVTVLGGLIGLLAPSLGTLLLILAAAGWVVIGLSSPQFGGIPLFGPATLAGLAALMALLATVFQRRGPAQGRDEASIEPSAAEATEAREREVALNMDPQLVARSDDTPKPTRAIPLTLEDVILPADDTRRSPADDVVWADENPSRASSDRTVPRRPIFSRPVPVERVRPRAELRTPRGGRLVPWLVMLNAVAVVVLAVAVGYLLLQPRSNGGAVAAVEAPSMTPAPQAVPVPVEAAQAPDQASASLAEPTAPSYADPFSYCGSIGTIDRIDARYAGPVVTEEIAAALGVPQDASGDRVHWRCVDGEVRACSSFGWPACDVTPTAEEMLEYCRQNPTVDRLMAPGGTWSCMNGRPELPEDASWPVDDRGFLPAAWIVVRQPGPT